MEDFKYISNYIKDENIGQIYLYGLIGDVRDNNGDITYGVNGAQFAYEMNYLQKNYPRINVKINSTGGSIIEGYAIFSSIRDCKVPVDIYIDGMCASMASIIAMAGDCVYMNDFALLMLHNPNNSADQELLDLLKTTLVMMISKRTGKSSGEIDKLMSNTTWMKSNEALKLGLVDSIIETKKKVNTKGVADPLELQNIFDRMLLEDITNLSTDTSTETSNIFNKKINKSEMENKNELSLIDRIKSILNKAETIEVEAKVDPTILNKEIESLKKTNKEMSDKLEAFTKKETEAKAKEVSDLVNSYVESKTIKSEEVESITNLLNLDFTTTKNLLDKSNVVKVGAPTNLIGMVTNTVAIPNEKQSWNLIDWAKKDPEGLDEMQVTNKIAYDELVNGSKVKFDKFINQG